MTTHDRGAEGALRGAEAFLREYLDAEHRAMRAVYTDADDVAVAVAMRDAERFLRPAPERPLPLPFGRAPRVDAEDLAMLREDAHLLAPRRLFLMRRYRHARFGELFAGVVSDATTDGQRRYAQTLFVATVDGAPAIVARWELDAAVPGVGWEPVAGADLGALEPPAAVLKLEPPGFAPHRADYDAA